MLREDLPRAVQGPCFNSAMCMLSSLARKEPFASFFPGRAFPDVNRGVVQCDTRIDECAFLCFERITAASVDGIVG